VVLVLRNLPVAGWLGFGNPQPIARDVSHATPSCQQHHGVPASSYTTTPTQSKVHSFSPCTRPRPSGRPSPNEAELVALHNARGSWDAEVLVLKVGCRRRVCFELAAACHAGLLPLTVFLSHVTTLHLLPAPPTIPTRLPPRGDVRVSGRAHTPSWVYQGRLTGRLWNTTNCLTTAPLTHSHAQLGISETAHGPTLEYHQLPHDSSTHSLTRPAGYIRDGSRADSGIPPAASRPLHSLTWVYASRPP
jgi:hypothetical protein